MESPAIAKAYTVVIPNKFEDVIHPLIESFRKYEKRLARVIIVSDGHDRHYGLENVRIDGPFVYSKSVNLGIKRAGQSDIILLNDDVTLLQDNTFDDMECLAYSDPTIGILSPQVDGGCGNLFMRPSHTELWSDGRRSVKNNLHYCCCRSGDQVTFACVYIKRKVFNTVGLFDENFTSYGFEDTDMCRRAHSRGFAVVVTNKLVVRHGVGGEKFIRGRNWNTSFMRTGGADSRPNLRYLMSKSSNGNQLI